MATDLMNATKPDPEVQRAERASPTDELGVTGLMSFSGQIEEAYLAELRYPAAYTKANEMRRRDPTIASLLNAIYLLARTASWSVEPAGSSDADKEATEFLEQNVADMSTTIEDASEDLLTAIWFGWAWSEIVYKRRAGPGAEVESKYDDQMVGWRKFAPRRQSSFYKWELDPSGGVQGLWQSVPMDAKGTRYLPIGKSLHFTAQRDQGNPEGLGLFEPVYEPWHYVKNLQIILGIGWQRAFVGLPVFTYGTAENPYTPTPEDKTLVAKVGKGLTANEKAFVAVPGQIGFELKSVENTGAASLLDTIKHYRINILATALADFIALGTTSTGGSYSLGADKSELFLMAIDGWLDKLAHVDKLGILNRYAVPRLFKYNEFKGITDYPRLKHSSVQKPNLGALAEYLQSLDGYIHPDLALEAELRRMAKLPAPVTDPEVLPKPPGDETTNAPANDEPPTTSPETGDEEDTPMNGDGAQMSRPSTSLRSAQDDPHPPARGQRYFFMEWQRMANEFKRAMSQKTEANP